VIDETLRVEGSEDVFAIGDCAACPQPGSDKPVPPRAQAAYQQAYTLAKTLTRVITNQGQAQRFAYKDYGSLISLIVSPRRSGGLDETIELNGQYSNNLYDSNKNSYSVALEFIEQEITDSDQSDNMFQNEPNPFVDYTAIPIYLSDAKFVSLRFYPRDGRLLHEHKSNYEGGSHQIVIDRKVLGQISGQVFYELSTDDIRLVRSMILVSK
jgi:hypothetical protein